MNQFKFIILAIALFIFPASARAARAIPGTPNIPPPLQPLPAQIAPNASHNIQYRDPNAPIPVTEQDATTPSAGAPPPMNILEQGGTSAPAALAGNSVPSSHVTVWRAIIIIGLILVVLLYALYRSGVITLTKPRS